MHIKDNIIIGRHPLLEAMEMNKPIDKILISRSVQGEIIETIIAEARKRKIPIQFVPFEKLNAVSRANHQGVIAYGSSLLYMDVQEVIDSVLSNGEVPLFMLLDGITDIRNIGAIARTALCCGVQAIIIPDKGVGALNEDAMKSSAGALSQLHICRVNSLMKTVDLLHANGIVVFASEMTASVKVFDIDFKQACAVVMGSEGKGIFQGLMKTCDAQFQIPITGKFDSFNVSVATGIILYEAMKQRMG